jgi:hypothetical protein
MSWTRRAFVTLAAAVLLLPLANAPAEAGAEAELLVARHRSGPFDPTIIRVNLDVGEAKTVWLKAKNVTSGTVEVELVYSADGSYGGYRSKYFRNGNNITQEIKDTTGYAFSIGADKAKKFELRIRRTVNSEGDGCVTTAVESPTDFAHVVLNAPLCS